MFDARLKKGIVFRIDADAAKELSLTEDGEWAISRDATAVEVRASRFKDGKPARGRPRMFKTSLVARLLGVTDLATPAPAMDDSVEADTNDSGEDEARVSSLIAGATPAASDEAPW